MQNLIAILYKYSAFFLFLGLQLICFGLLFSNKNTYQHSVFSSSSNAIVGSIYSTTTSISEYFSLAEQNELLLKENTLLKNQLKGYSIKVGELYTKVNDTLYLNQYEFLPAHAIRVIRTISSNSITIDKGIAENVKEDMGVIGTKGVIGRTIASSKHFSVVMPIAHPDFKLAVRHQKSNSFGVLTWTVEDDYKHATVNDIPEYIDVKKGDTIITSGADGLFPFGEKVGVVTKTLPVSGSTYQKIKIELIEDYAVVHQLYVVRNVLHDEQIKLESNAGDH